MTRCILVNLRNRVSGKNIFVGGFHTIEALRDAYPRVAGQPDPLLVHIPVGENLQFWDITFKDMQDDGGESVMTDPR